MHISSSTGAYALSSLSGVKTGQSAAQRRQVVPALPPADDISQQASSAAAQPTSSTANTLSAQALIAARQAGQVTRVSAFAPNAAVEERRGELATGPQDLPAQRAMAAYEAVASQEQAEELTLLGIDVFA